MNRPAVSSSGRTAIITNSVLDYCGETVRKHDPDRFLLCLLVDDDCRPALFALFAFNFEIAKTREVVTETALGLIRLQWWRDALAAVYDGKPVLKHQVLEPLAAAIQRYSLPREDFEAMIYAREFDLEDRLPASLNGMMNYAEFTVAPLLKLALKICGETAEDDLIKKTATCYALIGLMRAIPLHLVQRRCYLPEDVLQNAGVNIYALYEGKDIDKLTPVVRAIAELAGLTLAGLKFPKGTKILRLHAALAKMYLTQLRKADYRVYHLAPVPLLALRLWWASKF